MFGTLLDRFRRPKRLWALVELTDGEKLITVDLSRRTLREVARNIAVRKIVWNHAPGGAQYGQTLEEDPVYSHLGEPPRRTFVIERPGQK